MKRISLRTWVQICFTAITNGYAAGFAGGKIYQGPTKRFCLPGLNCYSCPGALGSCPIGSLQAVLSSKDYRFTFYIAGFLLLAGALLGRFICGWLCPFGLVQDLLSKIPLPRGFRRLCKLRKLPGARFLRYLKYIILIGFVIILPMVILDIAGQGSPWYCKYICPSGTLFAGIPLIAANPSLQSALGWIFTWKMAIHAVLVLLTIIVYRPFSRYLCPLGAIYGLFNPVAIYGFKIDKDACVNCNICQSACPLDIPVSKVPNSPECIRCGKCRAACPHAAIKLK